MRRSVLMGAKLAALVGVTSLLACEPGGGGGSRPLPPPPAQGANDRIRYAERRPFLKSENDYYVSDPFVGHLHRPMAQRRFRWSEHQRGEIVMQTNNLGLREDADTSPRDRDGLITILVTGDSHTDGVVWNSESFPNLVERELEKRNSTKHFDVLNGGVGHFGPYNYPRIVERYAFLDPAMVIVAFYAGNDFLDCAELLESTGIANQRGRDYYERLNALSEPLRRTASQHINQAYYLSVFPHMQAQVLDFAEAQLARLAGWCGSHGVELLVVLLPDKLTVERDEASLRQAAEALKLGVEDLTVGRRLTEGLRARLEGRNIEVLDLEPEMAGQHGLYWDQDHHLSSDGHRLVAETLLEVEGGRFDRLVALAGSGNIRQSDREAVGSP